MHDSRYKGNTDTSVWGLFEHYRNTSVYPTLPEPMRQHLACRITISVPQSNQDNAYCLGAITPFFKNLISRLRLPFKVEGAQCVSLWLQQLEFESNLNVKLLKGNKWLLKTYFLHLISLPRNRARNEHKLFAWLFYASRRLSGFSDAKAWHFQRTNKIIISCGGSWEGGV